MRAYKLLGMLTVCSLLPLQGAFAQTTHQQPPVAVQSELLPSQTLPVHLTMARLQNFDTGSELILSATKTQDMPMSGMMIDVYIRHNSRMLRGQRIAVNLSRRSSKYMSFTLQTPAHLMPGDAALVFVQGVQSSRGNQEISATVVNASREAFLQGKFANSFTGANIPVPIWTRRGLAKLSTCLSVWL